MTEFWDNRYRDAGAAYVFGKGPSQFVQAHAGRLEPHSKVFCPADGEGRNSCYLASLGHDVVACDYSAVGLGKARVLAAETGVAVDFRVADIENMEWPAGAYDAVVAVFIQFSPPEARNRVFAGMKQAVKPGGLILLHGYTPKQLEYKTGGPSQVENLYTAQMLRSAFDDFEIAEVREYDMALAEGAGHAGMSALVDLAAVRRKA